MLNNKQIPSKYRVTIFLLSSFVQLILFSIITFLLKEVFINVDKILTNKIPPDLWTIGIVTIPGRFFLKKFDIKKLYNPPWIIFPIGISFLIYFFIGIIIDAFRHAISGEDIEEEY